MKPGNVVNITSLRDKFDAEAEFFCAPKPKRQVMRFDVLLHSNDELEPFIGKVITDLPIKQWCDENGYILSVIQSHGPARFGEETDLT